MKPIQILLIVFVCFAFAKALIKFRSEGVKTPDFFFWMAIWVGAAFIIMFPNLTNAVADALGIWRGADLAVYSSLLVVFYLIFRIHLTLSHIEQEMTEVVRALALEKFPLEKMRAAVDDDSAES